MATREQSDRQMWWWSELSNRFHDFKMNPNDDKTRMLLETMAQYREAADLGRIGIKASGVADGTQVVLQHAENYPAINAHVWVKGQL